MDTITIPQSFLRNDLWQAADWRAQVVNDETGEILLTAVCGNDEEMIGVRLTTESVRQLRELTAFAEANMRRDAEQPAPDGSRVLSYDVAHECNGVWLAELEKIIGLHEHQVLDARRVEKLEGKLAAIERHQDDDAETFGHHELRLKNLEQSVARETGLRQYTDDRLTETQQRLMETERDLASAELALRKRVEYLERLAQGQTGPDAGL